jgi:EAL domain-containing protein (putative c-di-GMP-specific phosphodiesterase class I)
MSPRQFEDPALIERYAAILSETGMDPTCLDLEVTESVLLQGIEPIQRTLRTLREWGCSFSLDDFGTGYSSLSYLKTLPLSILKIDQVFVHQLAVNKKDAAITALIIEMAHTLGLTVVAEGVETVTQVSVLNRYGCDELQGYYITRPLEAESLTRFLQGDTLSLLRREAEASWSTQQDPPSMISARRKCSCPLQNQAKTDTTWPQVSENRSKM